MVRTKEMVAAITKATKLTEEQARSVVGALLETITTTLMSGEDVSLAHLGRFRVHDYPSKSIPDPRGRGQLIILPKKVVKFKPARHMRYRIETRKGHLHEIPETPPHEVIALQHSPTIEIPPDETVTTKDTNETNDGAPNWLTLFSRLKKTPPEAEKVIPTVKVVAPTEPVEPLVKPIDLEAPEKVTTDKTAKDKEDRKEYQRLTKPVDIATRDLSEITVDKEVLNLLPELFARRHKAIPIELVGNSLTVAMTDPQDLETIQLIKKSTSKDVAPILATVDDIDRILNQYSGLEAEVASVIKDNSLGITKQEITDAEHEDVKIAGDDSPTSRIVLSLLKRAVREKASDVHIEPYEKAVVVRFRIDGVLRTRVKLPKEIQPAVISRLKILGSLKIDEHRLPQDGRFRLEIDKNFVDFRLSTLPVADGEKAVMRILDKTQGILSLEELGVRGHGYDVVKSNIKKSYGMTLVTGPTGSGKTTTLYALLGQLMDVGVNIVTLEEPIEYRIEGINQSQVSTEIGYTFASGLRAIVRQDPDIIMVGEIRDKDTAEIAIQSALTGHIVLSTLHTNTAAGAIPRLIDMGVEPFLISSSLNTIVAQRLARKICDHCRTSYTPNSQEMSVINAELKKIQVKDRPSTTKFKFQMAKGCDVCNHTGYKGRLGLFEVLDVTPAIEELILKRSTDTNVAAVATKEGMTTMLQDGILKAIDGLTSLEEVWRVTRD